MTARGGASEEFLLYERGKRLCHAITVTRQDGEVIRVTDHDRQLTVDGEVFYPTSFGAMSADRREAAMRSGNQEMRGVIDGNVITVPDLEANRYRGAEVQIWVTDWENPWLIYAKHRKWIRSIVRDGSTYVGTVEGRTQALTRPTGGRFGGTWTTTCPYVLGDAATCKKDLTSFTKSSLVVDTVPDDRRTVRFTAASWGATSYDDDYYRDGSIVWLTGDNAGHTSAIVGYVDADIECSLLFPTPKPIQVGDTATVYAGCDGLRTTCKDKFNNVLNFGGDPYAPSASQIIEPIDEVT